MPTISRRLASEGTADPSDLRSPSLPGANPGAPTGVWLIGNSRPVRLKPEQPWECKSPHADQFWNVNRTSEPGLFAKQCAPCKGSVVRVHGIPPCARSSKRAGGLIPRIALDQCRVPERYRTRVPAFARCAAASEGCPPKHGVRRRAISRDNVWATAGRPFRTPERKVAPAASLRGDLAG